MIYLSYLLIGLLLTRCLIACANYVSFAYLPKRVTASEELKVSILIPARNEADNIGNLLKQLTSFNYSNMEIIVCNDNSSDETETIVKDWIGRNSKIKLINGDSLPKGWLGKNYACHQLSQQAQGDVFLFLDADVRVKKDIIKRSISHLQKHELHLLSIFPKQIVATLGEKISVPLMNWILLSLLPISLVRKSKKNMFAAANGQFMMYRATTFKSISPYEVCKSHKVEDIAIIRLFKSKNLRSDVRLGDDDMSCRMYNNLGEATEGFSKNIFEFFGNSIVTTILFWVLTTIGPFVVYLTLGLWWFMFYVGGILLIRTFVSLASQQAVLQNIVLALPQHIVFLLIIIKGLINNKQKTLIWKGRNILQD